MPYSVWYAIPSANPLRADMCLAKWKERGYRTAVLLNCGFGQAKADLVINSASYPGYWRATNALCRMIGDADIVVAGGDDISPDPNANPQQVAREFYEHFPDGFGVMQPTGDDLDGTDRICGSPWFGRAWLLESYRGRGPFCEDYIAFFGDEELFCVAQRLDALWQRVDLKQYHDHWMRGGPQTDYQQGNLSAHWESDKRMFASRKAADWPGYERQHS